jgi:hypothetical protein
MTVTFTVAPEVLASMELFHDLSPAALEEVMAAARLRRLAK